MTKSIILAIIVFSLLQVGFSTHKKCEEYIVCEHALDSILAYKNHKIINISKVKETTHLQWCFENYTELRLRQMLCAEDLKLAKLIKNKEQETTARKNLCIFENKIKAVLEEQDTATNNFIYEKIYEITYELEKEQQIIELTFLNNKVIY